MAAAGTLAVVVGVLAAPAVEAAPLPAPATGSLTQCWTANSHYAATDPFVFGGVRLTAAQIATAQTIADVSAARHLTDRSVRIAVAAAMNASGLDPQYRNGATVGLFAQPLSAVAAAAPVLADRSDPVAATRAFFERLTVQVPGYQDDPRSDAELAALVVGPSAKAGVTKYAALSTQLAGVVTDDSTASASRIATLTMRLVTAATERSVSPAAIATGFVEQTLTVLLGSVLGGLIMSPATTVTPPPEVAAPAADSGSPPAAAGASQPGYRLRGQQAIVPVGSDAPGSDTAGADTVNSDTVDSDKAPTDSATPADSATESVPTTTSSSTDPTTTSTPTGTTETTPTESTPAETTTTTSATTSTTTPPPSTSTTSTSKPTSSKDPTSKPSTSKPSTSKSSTSTTKPSTTTVPTTKPSTTEPSTTEPSTSKPSTTRPSASASSPTKSASSESPPSDSPANPDPHEAPPSFPANPTETPDPVDPNSTAVPAGTPAATVGNCLPTGGSPSQFDPGSIISDEVFYDTDSMTAAQIAAFLNNVGASCQGAWCARNLTVDVPSMPKNRYCDAYPGGRQSAATAIAGISAACGINPQVMLVTLQKEAGLLTRSDATQASWNAAWGWYCPDTGPGGSANCDPAHAGFVNQLYGMAQQWSRYKFDPGKYHYRAGQVADVMWNVKESGCGSAPVYIRNAATASLYNYTPYQPNAASLASYPAAGDRCSSYGNRNFFVLFGKYFGGTGAGVAAATTVSGTVVTLPSGPNVAAGAAGQRIVAPNSAVARGIAAGLASVGLPYVWGGGTNGGGPDQGCSRAGGSSNSCQGIVGFDCSGLTAFVLNQAGFSTGTDSGSQRSGGQRIPWDRAQPGDIIGYPGHVSIFLGWINGVPYMLQAPSVGKQVQVRTVYTHNIDPVVHRYWR